MRVVVALSGGVDSSVAAALLQKEGYDVIGMTLRLYNCDDNVNERSCCGISGVAEARSVAGHLGIPHYVVDGQQRFETNVLRRAWDDYAKGRTPNPCIACNEWLKFGLLFEHARHIGAGFVATGHHARVVRNGHSSLLRGRDLAKDQSYFLFSLSPQQLDMSLLPVGNMTKAEVRQLAAEFGLPNATRTESQDACIAQRGDLSEALRQRFDGTAKPGNFVDEKGVILGQHEGTHHYTVGQRKGLGIALGQRAYVVAVHQDAGDVVISTDPKQLEVHGLWANQTRWIEPVEPNEPVPVQVQIRYRSTAVPATLWRRPTDAAADLVEVHFDDAVAAVTPGQAAVFYDGDRVLGGAWIDKPIRTTATADA